MPDSQVSDINFIRDFSAETMLPNVPTIAESGYPGFESVAAYGFFAPTGTPAHIINQLNKVIVEVLKDPSLKAKLLESGIEVGGSTPAELQYFVNGEVNKWAKVIKEGNLKPQGDQGQPKCFSLTL